MAPRMPSAAIPTVYSERTPYPQNARCVSSEGDETCTLRTVLYHLEKPWIDFGCCERILVVLWFRHEVSTEYRCTRKTTNESDGWMPCP